jgi:predicted type IV restriction endonuclease
MLIGRLIEDLRKLPPEEVDGVLNYVFTRVLRKVYPARYYHYNKAVGVLECIKQEYYRRVVAPYEDKKMQETGDIEETREAPNRMTDDISRKDHPDDK